MMGGVLSVINPTNEDKSHGKEKQRRSHDRRQESRRQVEGRQRPHQESPGRSEYYEDLTAFPP